MVVGLVELVLLAASGVFGFAADRLAVRWPEHDEEHPAGRPLGWRTVATVAMAIFAAWVFAVRLGGYSPLVQVVFGAWFATLIVGFAVDLDQRLLPDELTLPVIPIALMLDLTGNNPLVGTALLQALLVAAVVPVGLYLLSIPFGAGGCMACALLAGQVLVEK